MFECSETVRGAINLDSLWGLYSDVSQWKNWDGSVDEVQLNGSFSEGSRGVMYMKNGQELPFAIESVTRNEEFTTVSELGTIKVTFIHLVDTGSITHKVVVEGVGMNEEQLAGIGQRIAADLPETVKNLLGLASV